MSGARLVGVLSLAVVASGLTCVVPDAPASAVSSVSVSGRRVDVPTSPSHAVGDVRVPRDPADGSGGLPKPSSADLPADGVDRVDASGAWVQVPGEPVAVRVPQKVASGIEQGDGQGDGPGDGGDGTEGSSGGEQDGQGGAAGRVSPSVGGGSTSAPDAGPSAGLDSSSPSAGDGSSVDPSADSTDGPTDGSTGDSAGGSAGSGVPQVVVGTSAGVSDGSASTLMLLQVTSPVGAEGPVGSDDPGGLASSPAVSVGGVDVRVSYADFAQLYGADWSSRLSVVAYPECYLTSPQEPECAVGVPVDVVHQDAQDALRFTTLDPAVVNAGTGSGTGSGSSGTGSGSGVVPGGAGRAVPHRVGLAAAGSGSSGGTVYAVSSGPGTYGATPVSAAGEWQVGVGSGEFSYSYPFSLPGAFVGATPSLGLSYSSGAVDGMTSAVNGGTSPAGLGWDMTPGSIVRSYFSCADDTSAGVYQDLCWKTKNGSLIEELTLNLGGRVSRMVRDAAHPNTFRLRDDPGWRIQRFKSGSPSSSQPSNDDNDNEGFEVTSADGTQYWFGWGRGGTNSVLTVPVYGNQSGEPCFNASKLAADRWCQQGWEWNLDRVVDPSGNVTTYKYAKETNSYFRWGTDNVAYDRWGELAEVDYGVDPDSGQAREKVTIGRVRRCTSLSAACPNPYGSGVTGAQYPDVPLDLLCSANQTGCPTAPSFFGTYAYTQVQTWSVSGSGSSAVSTPVDRWDLSYTFPNPDAGQADATGDDPRDMWLNSITHTGLVGGSLALPPTQFSGVALRNRVDAGQTKRYYKFRLASVRNETGGRTDVTYGQPQPCTFGDVHGLERWQSPGDCFQTEWLNDNQPPKQLKWAWFNKYVVTKVSLGDDALGYGPGQSPNGATEAKLRVYAYTYQGDPGWRFTSSPNKTDAHETWSDWRGYGVTVVDEQDASGNVLSRQRIARYRGLNGTPSNTSGGTKTAYLDTLEHTDSHEPDYQWLNGQTAEVATEDASGQVLTRIYHSWRATPVVTIDNGINGDTTGSGGNAKMAIPAETKQVTALFNPDGTRTGASRSRVIDYTYDTSYSYSSSSAAGVGVGRLLQTADSGAVGKSGDETCTQYGWAFLSSIWMRAQARSQTWQGACPDPTSDGSSGSVATPTGALLSDQHTYYDGQETGKPFTRGLPTAVDTATGTPSISGGPGDGQDAGGVIRTKAAYDDAGRVISTNAPAYLDGPQGGTGALSTIAYNPGKPGVPLSKVVTTQADVNSAGLDLTTTTDLDPARGLPTTVTDPNGGQTLLSYNPLGQTTGVREPGQGASDPANIVYTYTTSATAPSRVKTSTLRDLNTSGGGVYDDAYTYYDGWGRQVETQTANPNDPGQRIVALTGYDARGLTSLNAPAIPNAAAAGSGLLNPDMAQVARYTTTSYDPAGRVLTVADKSLGTTVDSATTAYLGDGTITQPATGGVSVARIDALGNTTSVELHSVHNPAALDTSNDTVLDASGYGYDGLGQLTSMSKTITKTVASGAGAGTSSDYTWSYGYDLAGRRLWAYDPDTGATSTTYDAAGQPVTVTTGHTGPQADAIDTSSRFAPIVDTPSSIIATHYDALERPTERLDYTEVHTAGDDPTTMATWGYDDPQVANSRGRLTSQTEPITGVSQWLGNSTDNGVHVTTIGGYDNRGNPTSTSETVPRWVTSTVQVDPSQTTTYTWSATYNQLGDPTTQTYPAVPGIPAQTVTTAYTTGARVASITTSDPTTSGAHIHLADQTYNNIGQTTGLDTGRYTTDTANGVAGRSDQNDGVQRDYTWRNDTGRLATTSVALKSTDAAPNNGPYTATSLAYTYDATGNPTRISELAQLNATGTASTKQFCYTYDPAQRLTRAATGAANDPQCATPKSAPSRPDAVTDPDYDISYNFTGDRLTSVDDNIGVPALAGQTLHLSYENANAATGGQPHQTTKTSIDGGILDQLLGAVAWPAVMPSPGTMTYDGQGRITGWQASAHLPTHQADLLNLTDNYTYTYDHAGNLTTTTPVLAAGLTNIVAKTVTNSYRADSTRLIRQTSTAAGVIEQTTLYLADGTELTNNTVGNTTIRNFTTPAGTPLASETGSEGLNPQWTYLYADGQNSLRLSVTATTAGHLTPTRLNYYPYGDPTNAHTPTTPGNRGYLDKPHDANGDIRLDARTYTANLNQLTTPDPLLQPGDPLSANPYTYSRNNPLTFSDPTGLVVKCGSRPCVVPQPAGDADAITPTPDVGDSNAGSDAAASRNMPSGSLAATPEWFRNAMSENDMSAKEFTANQLNQMAPDASGQAEIEAYYCANFDSSRCGGRDVMLSALGVKDGIACFGHGSVSGCGWFAVGLIPGGKLGDLARGLKEAEALTRAANDGRVLKDVEHLPCNCFVAGTKVHTVDGTKPIERIKVGDKVWAKNLTTGKNELRTVTGLFHKHADQVMTITVADGAKVTVTQEHPFYVTGVGWVMSGDLKVGDPLAQRDGGSNEITAISVAPTDTTVYNFTVDGDHNYYVTEAQLLVHNCPVGHGGHQFPDVVPRKSQFFDNLDLHSLTNTDGMTGYLQPNGRTRFVKIYRGGDVGVDATTGLPTDMYTIIRGPNGNVVTMYPGTSPMG